MGEIGAAVGMAGGIAKSIMGANQASKAKKAIENYDRQELVNTMEAITVSTRGSDLAREELARTSASSIDALQSGGVRGVVGGIGKVQQSVSKQSQEIGAKLDQKLDEKSLAVAKDNVRIQGLQEEREKADLAGLGQQMMVGQQNLFSGISDVAQSATAYGQQQDDKLASVAGIFGGMMGGSDRRLKENIQKIGQSIRGFNIYLFNYIGERGLFQGVMSDELPKEYITKDILGYDMVNYSGIDVEFRKIY